jgi:hypothetical protein
VLLAVTACRRRRRRAAQVRSRVAQVGREAEAVAEAMVAVQERETET